MQIRTAIILLAICFVYIIALCLFIFNLKVKKHTELVLDQTNVNKKVKTFYFEQKILDKLGIKPKKVKVFLWLERLLMLFLIVSLLFVFRSLGMVMIACIITTFIFEDMNKKVIYKSGITNIEKINNFINFFVPHLSSGNSVDQSLLEYIQDNKDNDLAEFYENRNNPNFELKVHVKQIVDIYEVAKYNEQNGMSNYTHILNEIAKDYEAKQIYYNDFISGMGEVKPTTFAYYLGVPFLIFISYSQTREFWFGFGGFVVCIILYLLFLTFKFLIYKLQKDTIETIF